MELHKDLHGLGDVSIAYSKSDPAVSHIFQAPRSRFRLLVDSQSLGHARMFARSVFLTSPHRQIGRLNLFLISDWLESLPAGTERRFRVFARCFRKMFSDLASYIFMLC